MDTGRMLRANPARLHVVSALILSWHLAAGLRTRSRSNGTRTGDLPIVPASNQPLGSRARMMQAAFDDAQMSARGAADGADAEQAAAAAPFNRAGKAFILPGPGPGMSTIVTYPSVQVVPSGALAAAQAAQAPAAAALPVRAQALQMPLQAAPLPPDGLGQLFAPAAGGFPQVAGSMPLLAPMATGMPAMGGAGPVAMTLPVSGGMVGGGMAPMAVGVGLPDAGLAVPAGGGGGFYPLGGMQAAGFALPASMSPMGLPGTAPMMRAASVVNPNILQANSVLSRERRELANMAAQARLAMSDGEGYYRDGP